jgi:serine/threonine protein kinase
VLDYLHTEKRIIHRDIKSSNLLITTDLRVSKWFAFHCVMSPCAVLKYTVQCDDVIFRYLCFMLQLKLADFGLAREVGFSNPLLESCGFFGPPLPVIDITKPAMTNTVSIKSAAE